MLPTDDVRSRLARVARFSLDPDLADAWLAMLTPGVRLLTVTSSAPQTGQEQIARPWRRAGTADLQRPAGSASGLTAGWLGGPALLPEGVPWPEWDGHGPLAHIATIDCTQLHSVVPPQLRDSGFPATGWLSFFYFDGSVDGGVEVVGAMFAGTAAGAKVQYTPPGRAVRAHPPAPVDEYPAVEITAEPVLTYPTWEHPRLYQGGRPADGWDDLYEAINQLEPRPAIPVHQVGGHPDPVQGPVELEVACGLASRGRQDKISRTDPSVIAVADDLVLLAQLDTDDRAGFLWGDAGVLYYLIRPADLAAGRFDRAVFTWQCG